MAKAKPRLVKPTVRVIENRTFENGPRHNRQVIANYVLKNCTFDGWAGLTPDWKKPDPARRPTIRNVTLENTRAYSAFLQGVIFEDVTVDTTIAGKGPIFLRGNAYKHVVLKGKIGPTVIEGEVFPSTSLPKEEQERITAEWDAANAAYYQSVDWAIDITQAVYGSLSITGIPTRLIRRNAENTAVMTREQAIAGKWKKLRMRRTFFSTVISLFLNDRYDEVLLIACPKGKYYQDELHDLNKLRQAGVVE
jgi:hypothetical protein